MRPGPLWVVDDTAIGASPTMNGLFPSLAGYKPAWLRGDILAGLTVWAVLVPEALAYATIAGVSPVVGLYAPPDGDRTDEPLRIDRDKEERS